MPSLLEHLTAAVEGLRPGLATRLQLSHPFFAPGAER